MSGSTLRRLGLAGTVLLALGAFAFLPQARADARDNRAIAAVIELYTSQGCSSCPPADALLKSYAKRRDVMALSLPVDYWDRLGWKDTFASPQYSARQRDYVHAIGEPSVYTPQVIVNGTASAVGSRQYEVDHAIRSTKAAFTARRVPILGTHTKDGVVVNIGSQRGEPAPRPATVWLLKVTPSADVAIKRGENGGRTVTYTNIVRSMVPIGKWSGKPVSIPIARKANRSERTAVLLQEGRDGPIIGAAWLDG